MSVPSLFKPHHALANALLPTADPTGSDAAHDLSHILRVWRNVKEIAAVEGGDLEILTAATLLHDSVPIAKDAPERAQASILAADHAARTLQDLDWQERRIAAVVHAIQAHSFSAKIVPKTLEARILQDADRLDALGHIGIARCFAVSGRLGRALYDPGDPMAEHRALDDHAYALDHFQTKLLRLADGFQTPTGRSLASARHQVLQEFVTGFLREVGGHVPSLAQPTGTG